MNGKESERESDRTGNNGRRREREAIAMGSRRKVCAGARTGRAKSEEPALQAEATYLCNKLVVASFAGDEK